MPDLQNDDPKAGSPAASAAVAPEAEGKMEAELASPELQPARRAPSQRTLEEEAVLDAIAAKYNAGAMVGEAKKSGDAKRIAAAKAAYRAACIDLNRVRAAQGAPSAPAAPTPVLEPLSSARIVIVDPVVPASSQPDFTEHGRLSDELVSYAQRIAAFFCPTKADLVTLTFQHLLARNLKAPRDLWRENNDLAKIAEDIVRKEIEDQKRCEDLNAKIDKRQTLTQEEAEFFKRFKALHPELSDEQKLLRLAEEAMLFHDEHREPFVNFCVFGKLPHDLHYETWPVKSRDFKLYLRHRFYLATGGTPEQRVFERVIEQLAAMAVFDGPQEPIHLRVAEHDGATYINLADPDWRVAEIRPERVRVLHSAFAPIRFRRPTSMAPIPFPVPLADETRPVIDIDLGWLGKFRPLLGVDRPSEILFLAWLTASMRMRGPKPGAVLRGTEGSAKSTKGRIAQKLIDPSGGDLLGLPKSIDDLIVTSKHTWLLAFDNLTYLSDDLSDALCRFSTGGGQMKRGLYTDDDLNIIAFRRPWILTSITDVVTHADLLSRSIFFDLPEIPPESRMQEEHYWREFEKIRPAVHWGLYRAIAMGLRNLPTVSIPSLPRMADFAAWGIAVAPGLGYTQEQFIGAYKANIAATKHLALANSPVAEGLIEFMQKLVVVGETEWAGTMSGLLANLVDHAGEFMVKSPAWPKTSAVLGKHLRRMQQSLASVGIEVTFPPGRADGREVVITQKAPR